MIKFILCLLALFVILLAVRCTISFLYEMHIYNILVKSVEDVVEECMQKEKQRSENNEH